MNFMYQHHLYRSLLKPIAYQLPNQLAGHMPCLSNKVKDWELFSDSLNPLIHPQPQASSDRELFSEMKPQIIVNREPSETPIHRM